MTVGPDIYRLANALDGFRATPDIHREARRAT
jgi:hypothetical protein